MHKRFLMIGITLIMSSIFINTSAENYIFAISKSKQNYQVGYATGCQDGQSGKEPDRTQYDKVGGFSKHSIAYNTGYVDGFNSCSTTFQI